DIIKSMHRSACPNNHSTIDKRRSDFKWKKEKQKTNWKQEFGLVLIRCNRQDRKTEQSRGEEIVGKDEELTNHATRFERMAN
ncbi:unnamed protein product, partial [Heterotrigona itama]